MPGGGGETSRYPATHKLYCHLHNRTYARTHAYRIRNFARVTQPIHSPPPRYTTNPTLAPHHRYCLHCTTSASLPPTPHSPPTTTTVTTYTAHRIGRRARNLPEDGKAGVRRAECNMMSNAATAHRSEHVPQQAQASALPKRPQDRMRSAKSRGRNGRPWFRVCGGGGVGLGWGLGLG